jgi:hypothetical protein
MRNTLLIQFFLCITLIVSSQSTTLVSIDANGKLTYTADEKGNVIPDFSGVGYRNSEASIPFVPVVKTVTAVAGDNVANVQNAINEVAAMPLVNGIRGAILFKAGTYGMNKAINVNASGIVLRGEGLSTNFRATGTVQYDLINIMGTSGKTDLSSSQKKITDAFVPIGAKTVTVEAGHDFAIGDWVHVRREPNDAWITLLGMDKLTDLDPLATNWTASGYKISYERKILKVQGNLLTLDAPIMDVIDPVYANGFVVKFSSARIQNCAVENMQITSTYTSSTDENHGWKAIAINNAENCWVKKVTAYSFGYSCVFIDSEAAFVTVDSCAHYDPISVIDGGRRYCFNVNGDRCLVQNCNTRRGRHDYVDGSRTPGPTVFYNCTASLQKADLGPHHRWSTGILLDNILGDGQLRVQDRADSGSGHGWSGSQIMFWNCTAGDIVIQDPPSYHRNWAIGCVGPITNVGQWKTHPLGIVESKGVKITAIPSLFKAQLAERLRGLSTSISTTKSEHVDFQLVPIPAKNQIQIKTNIPETTEVQWSICDVAGKIMTTNPTSRTIDNAKVNVSFNISNLKSGVYFVNASNKNFSKSMKFIIQN